jgi:hypothetical protein
MHKQALGHGAAIGLAVAAACGIAAVFEHLLAALAGVVRNLGDRRGCGRCRRSDARREGALMIYTTGTQIQPLLDRFRQKYPYLRIQLPRASSVEVAVKVT